MRCKYGVAAACLVIAVSAAACTGASVDAPTCQVAYELSGPSVHPIPRPAAERLLGLMQQTDDPGLAKYVVELRSAVVSDRKEQLEFAVGGIRNYCSGIGVGTPPT